MQSNLVSVLRRLAAEVARAAAEIEELATRDGLAGTGYAKDQGKTEGPADRILLRIDEAGHLMGLGSSKVYELVARGQIPAIRIGRSVRIRQVALERWLKQEERLQNPD